MKIKRVLSFILVAALLLSCCPVMPFSIHAAEDVYEEGYTWAFDKTVTLGNTKGLVSGNAADTIQVMNHEGNNSLTPNRAIANGVLTTTVAANWSNTVGHAVFYQLPAGLEAGRIYQLSMNLYGGNDAAAMNGITVSFGDYTTILTGAGGNIQQWTDAKLTAMHSDAKITRSVTGNLSTAADNAVVLEFVATEEMAANDDWMLITFPLTLNGSYKLGSVTMKAANFEDGYTWAFDKTIEAFGTTDTFKKPVYGNEANTVGIINHEVNADYGSRSLKNGVLSTVVTAGWNKAAHGVYYKLPADLVVGQEYVVSMNLYASAEDTPITNSKTTDMKLSFVSEPNTTQVWLATEMKAYHNEATMVTYRAPDYLSTDATNKLAVTFVATAAMAENDGWMLITFPLETGMTVNLGETTMEEKKDTTNHLLNGDFSDGFTGWMTNSNSSYLSIQNGVLDVTDKVPTGDVKLYQSMYLEAGTYRLSFDVFGNPTSWRPVYFMGTALDNSSVTGQNHCELAKEPGKSESGWWKVTRDVTIETPGMYYFQMNLNKDNSGNSVAPAMQYDNFELRKLLSVTTNADNATLTDTITTVAQGLSYENTVTAKEGYHVTGVTVTMNEVAVENAYDAQTGKITVPVVTGNLEVTVATAQCADSDKNHNCDVGGEKLSDCVDTNPKDHKCDICEAPMGTHADGDDNDHVCDYCGGEVAGEEHDYENGFCTECGAEDPDFGVAQIGDTKFGSFADALAAAQAGQTIVLKSDIDYGTDPIKLMAAITIDLNGNTLTAGGLAFFENGGSIVDNGATKGLLKLPAASALIMTNAAANSMLPVWNEEGTGYVFVSVQHQSNYEAVSEDSFQLVIRPDVFGDTATNEDYLADGAADNGLKLQVKIHCMKDGVNKQTVVIDIKDELIGRIYNNNSAIKLTVNGAGTGYDFYEIEIVLVSDRGAAASKSVATFTPGAAN